METRCLTRTGYALALLLVAIGHVAAMTRDLSLPSGSYVNGDLTGRSLLGLSSAQPRATGGENAAEGRFPYMFSLRNSRGTHWCGAVLIHPYFVLTAAHCVHPDIKGSVGRGGALAIGVYDRNDDEETPGVELVKIRKTTIHEDYNPANVAEGSDIAILELHHPSTVTPISLPQPLHPHEEGEEFLALGWGRGSRSSKLQQVFLKVQSATTCSAAWGDTVEPSLFWSALLCADATMADTCQGDSGGPLLAPYTRDFGVETGEPHLDTLVALTSFGPPKCAASDQPGVYTVILHHLDWIESFLPQRTMIPPQPCHTDGSCPETNEKLREAARNGSLTEVKRALARGADLEATDGDGRTPLYIAAREGHIEVVEYLIAKGANVEVQDKDGQFPLFWASWHGHLDIVNALLSAGAVVDMQTSYGSTALYWASSGGNLDVVNALISAGADVNLIDEDGKTAIDFASESNFGDPTDRLAILSALRLAGAATG